MELHLLLRAVLNTSKRVDLSKKITNILESTERSLVIVQVGSNDGKTHDPLYQGLMDNEIHISHHIEAIPQIWKELNSTYSSRQYSYCHNLLISEHDGFIPFYTIKEMSATANNLPIWWRMVGSTRETHAITVFPKLTKSDIESTQLKTTTPSAFLKEAAISSIDLLHIDAEGADYKILSAFLKITRPRWILIEHKHLTLKQLFLLRFNQLIKGYSCLRNKDDFLFSKA